MSTSQVVIVGAGIAGLTLGRCLRHHAIPAILYERDSFQKASARHNYGITLHRDAYHPLLKQWNVDENTFKSRVAVDAANSAPEQSDAGAESSFRANRRKFECLLREGLDIRWDHQLDDLSVERSESRSPVVLKFRNGDVERHSVIVGADGPHSRVRKQFVAPGQDANILPYAVYNGKRRLDRGKYDEVFGSITDHVLHRQLEKVQLMISVDDITDNTVSISYTFSRSARKGQSDPLYRPQRDMKAATVIPEELFSEIDALKGQMDGPFCEVFRSDAMREDRLLNWLMRSMLVERKDLERAAEEGIVLLGDSCHDGPILGSEGANNAIQDAVALAEVISGAWSDDDKGKVQKTLSTFYVSRWDRWDSEMSGGAQRLNTMHETSTAAPSSKW